MAAMFLISTTDVDAMKMNVSMFVKVMKLKDMTARSLDSDQKVGNVNNLYLDKI